MCPNYASRSEVQAGATAAGISVEAFAISEPSDALFWEGQVVRPENRLVS